MNKFSSDIRCIGIQLGYNEGYWFLNVDCWAFYWDFKFWRRGRQPWIG